MVLQQATFFRKSAFERTSGFNVDNRTCWDGELLADIAIAGGRLAHVSRRWGAFAIYPEHRSTGSRRDASQAVRDVRRIFRKLQGREWRRPDQLISRLVRLEKWILSPGATLRRLRFALLGPPGTQLVVADDQSIELVSAVRQSK